MKENELVLNVQFKSEEKEKESKKRKNKNSETILFDTVRVDTLVKQMSYTCQNL